MLKRLIAFVVFIGSLHATTWFATSSSVNINAANLWVPTSTGSCTGSGTALVWGAQTNGDIFDANGCTSLAVNVDPGGASVQVTLETNTTSGGNFTYATANNLTIHAHIVSLKSTALIITGNSGGGTIDGNVTGCCNGGYGVNDSHSIVTMTVNGNLVGGTSTNGFGYIFAGGHLVVNGNASSGSAATSSSAGLEVTSNGQATVNGNCVGSASGVGFGAGCHLNSGNTATLTVTGNIIDGLSGPGVRNDCNQTTCKFFYAPSSPTNYVLYPKDSSYTLGVVDSHATEMPIAPSVSNVKSGVQFGTFTGTLATTGGGVQTTVQN